MSPRPLPSAAGRTGTSSPASVWTATPMLMSENSRMTSPRHEAFTWGTFLRACKVPMTGCQLLRCTADLQSAQTRTVAGGSRDAEMFFESNTNLASLSRAQRRPAVCWSIMLCHAKAKDLLQMRFQYEDCYYLLGAAGSESRPSGEPLAVSRRIIVSQKPQIIRRHNMKTSPGQMP